MLMFTVPGRPVTWQRPTDDPRSGRRNVTMAEQRKEKRRIATLARAALPPGWPTDVEYAIEVIGYWPDRRFGDSDRLVSLTMDALEGVAYRADRQVSVQCGARLLDRERPRVEVVVCALRANETASVNIDIQPREEMIGDDGNSPCAEGAGPVPLSTLSRPRADGKRRPRGVGAPGVGTEPGKVAR